MGEAHCGVINACLRWDHWYAKIEKKLQEMNLTRNSCANDTTRHVVDLRNWKKEVDSFMGIQLHKDSKISLKVDSKQMVQRRAVDLGISYSILVPLVLSNRSYVLSSY
jgi:hypothetical protein